MKFLAYALALYWLRIMDNFSKNLCGKKVRYTSGMAREIFLISECIVPLKLTADLDTG